MMYCHASQDAYFYDYQTHGVHLYQIVRKMRGIMTLLQQKGIMYLSSCYINSLPAVLQWQPQTGRKVAIIGFLVYLRDRLKQPGPHIVITPAERIVQWRDEFLWWSPESRRAAAGRAELLANPAIRAQMLAGSIQTPHGLCTGCRAA